MCEVSESYPGLVIMIRVLASSSVFSQTPVKHIKIGNNYICSHSS